MASVSGTLLLVAPLCPELEWVLASVWARVRPNRRER